MFERVCPYCNGVFTTRFKNKIFCFYEHRERFRLLEKGLKEPFRLGVFERVLYDEIHKKQ